MTPEVLRTQIQQPGFDISDASSTDEKDAGSVCWFVSAMKAGPCIGAQTSQSVLFVEDNRFA